MTRFPVRAVLCRWILTGTPLQNELSDAFALLQFLRVSPMGCRRWWKENVAALEERGGTLQKRGPLSFCRKSNSLKHCLSSGMMADAVRTVRRSLLPVMLRRQGSDLDEEGRPLLALPRLTIHTFTLQLTCGERAFYQVRFASPFLACCSSSMQSSRPRLQMLGLAGLRTQKSCCVACVRGADSL